jgi:DNA-binding NtrC family response regulator
MFQTLNVLIVDDDEALVKVFEKVAKDRGWSYRVAHTGTEAIEQLGTHLFELAVVDIKLPGYSGMQVLDYIKQNGVPSEVLIITGVGTVESAVSAIKKGAYDYLTKPFDDIEKVAIVMEKAMERYRLVQKLHRLERQASDTYEYEGIIGKSQKIQEVFSTLDSIAVTSSTILVLGESGTGKELVARAIHNRSQRSEKPFVVQKGPR